MSTKTSGANNSVPTNAELAQELRDVKNRLETVESDKDELATSLAEQRERADRAEAERDELREEVERANASRGHIIEDIVDVEQQLEARFEEENPEGHDGETTLHRPDMTPIERLSKMDAEDTGIEVTPSIERAVTIFDHWREWSSKTPKGRVLKTGLKTLLRTATGDRLNWKQAYRAAEALEELSKGQIQFMKHRRHGKMLIEPSEANGDCHSTTAATT